MLSRNLICLFYIIAFSYQTRCIVSEKKLSRSELPRLFSFFYELFTFYFQILVLENHGSAMVCMCFCVADSRANKISPGVLEIGFLHV